MTAKKPLLFFSAFPVEGHTNPCLVVASSMIQRGYDVVFYSSADFEPKIRAIGAEFAEWTDPAVPPGFMEKAAATPPGLSRFVLSFSDVFLGPMPLRAANQGAALAKLRAREGPERQIIILNEIANVGWMPYMYGRPPPEGFDTLPRLIGLSTLPLVVKSVDTAPFTLGLPPDSTPSGRLRNKALHDLVEECYFKPAREATPGILREAGATAAPDINIFYHLFDFSDITLQFCSPSLEYPLSDLSPKIKFAGCLPKKSVPAGYEFPSWWADVTTAKSKGKKVVFVSQGTVNLDYTQLIVPTLKALAGRDDLVVVVALGKRDASLPEGTEVPSNTHVIDYIPYDLVLEHADVFVSNAGYGAICHTTTNGVPGVFAGQTEDKAEVCARAEYTGLAYNLRTQTPTVEQVKGGIEVVLGDEKWKKRAMELRAENEAMSALDVVEKQIIEYTQ